MVKSKINQNRRHRINFTRTLQSLFKLFQRSSWQNTKNLKSIDLYNKEFMTEIREKLDMNKILNFLSKNCPNLEHVRFFPENRVDLNVS
jgi:hypothetical protein